MYSIVHTGANTSFGGLKNGLLIVKYQLLTPSITNRLDKLPTVSGIKIHIISFKAFNVLLVQTYYIFSNYGN